MLFHREERNSANFGLTTLPLKFTFISVLAFVTSVSATTYFIHTMCCGMKMPGNWSMSMMWMRMPGQTWLTSGLNFLLMWIAMMIAMMMPSVFPTFVRTGWRLVSLCYMLVGYFAIWLAAGVVIYISGVIIATFAMQSIWFSHAIPILLGAMLIVAGAIQFSHWKMARLLRCRSSFGCAISSPPIHERSFQLGCKQGVACCLCCAAPMTIQLALGIMNPLLMIVIAMIIAAEKLLPRPEITGRLVGIAAIIAGIIMAINGDFLPNV
jgi:predicted metal-binding membrane protein